MAEFTVKVYFLDGHTKTLVWDLPENATIYVNGGHIYSLDYTAERGGCSPDKFGTLKRGVIDYEILSKKKLKP